MRALLGWGEHICGKHHLKLETKANIAPMRATTRARREWEEVCRPDLREHLVQGGKKKNNVKVFSPRMRLSGNRNVTRLH